MAIHTCCNFLNGAVFGIYSYLAEYLDVVTKMSPYMISIMLFVYGLANIIGNILAGRLLTIAPVRTVIIYPFALMILYFVFFFVSDLAIPTAILL